MSELDDFEVRLAAAVGAFADRADTRVDAATMAGLAMGRRRTGAWTVLDRSVPVPIALLLLLALLYAVLIASLGGGAPWDRRSAVGPVAVDSPAPSGELILTPAPARTTDGQGAEVVTGTELVTSLDAGQDPRVDAILRVGSGVAATVMEANDPRVGGTGTWTFHRDVHDGVAVEWGTYRLENAGGVWEGTCRGGTWDAGTAAMRSCWLTGFEAYAGHTYYVTVTQTSLGSGAVEGVIYPGPAAGP